MSFWGALSVAIVCAAGSPRSAPKAGAPKTTAAPTASAHAQARAAFRSGQQLFRSGRFTEAITQFERAYELKPHAAIFFNLARCHEELGHVTLALKAYRTYLYERPDAADREAVLASVGALERKLQVNNLQQLMVHTEPADAAISIDGTPLGSSPIFVELGPGEHRLKIEREGLEPVSRSFVMSTERSLEFAFVLQAPALPAFTLEATAPPAPAPVAANEAAKPAPTAPTLAPAPPIETPAVTVAPKAVYPLRSAAWAPLTLTALGAAGTATGFIVANRMARDLDQELAANGTVTPRAQTLARSGQTAQTLAWVGVGVTAAGAVTSIVFLAVNREAKVAPTLSLAPGAAGVGVSGVFP